MFHFELNIIETSPPLLSALHALFLQVLDCFIELYFASLFYITWDIFN